MKPSVALCVVLALLAFARPLRADSLRTTLRLEGATEKQDAETVPVRQQPRDSRRAVLHARVNEPLTVRWTCVSPDGKAVPDVLVHFFVVREDRLNQAQVPDLKLDRVVVESALTMDFKDRDPAKANLSFKVDQPGTYLVRIEAQTPDATQLTENFAALDLEVK
ncbi:MAG: hypothetical protein ACYDH9_15950 [Limisphaerales bacterium]